MEITEAKIKLMPARSDRLQAFCTITLDNDFVIRDIKIIEGAKGAFVAMPSRKLTDKCHKCSGKNHLRARFCNDCGARLDENRASKDKRGRAKLHADIAHPINSACRERLQAKILDAFHAEVEKSKQPGYVAPKLEDEDEYVSEYDDQSDARHEAAAAAPPAAVVTPPSPPPPAPPAPRPVAPEPEPAREAVRKPEPEPAREAKRPESDDEAEIRRLEEEVERYEERERAESERDKNKEKKDDFSSGVF